MEGRARLVFQFTAPPLYDAENFADNFFNQKVNSLQARRISYIVHCSSITSLGIFSGKVLVFLIEAGRAFASRPVLAFQRDNGCLDIPTGQCLKTKILDIEIELEFVIEPNACLSQER